MEALLYELITKSTLCRDLILHAIAVGFEGFVARATRQKVGRRLSRRLLRGGRQSRRHITRGVMTEETRLGVVGKDRGSQNGHLLQRVAVSQSAEKEGNKEGEDT